MAKKKFTIKFTKLEKRHGLLIGWGAIGTINGEPYVDRDGDQWSDEVLFDSYAELKKAVTLGKMHEEDDDGNVISNGNVDVLPLTKDVQSALGLKGKHTGLAVIARPDKETMARFDAGELPAFSAGGTYEVADA